MNYFSYENKNFTISFLVFFFFYIGVNAQVKVQSTGRVIVGEFYYPNNYDPDNAITLQVFGPNFTNYASGGKIAIGDYGRPSSGSMNVMIRDSLLSK